MNAARPGGRRGPAFDHIEAWVFDLDNTLYPASCNLFAEIDRRMRDFIAHHCALDAEAARRLQKDYFHAYGTTLRGLMLNHGVDPADFLEYVHAIDMSALAPDPGLGDALSRLEGRKIVFTNGSARHAEKVMERLGVSEHFEGVFDVIAADYRCKPDPAAYHALVARHGLAPRATAIFEDLPQNLAPAAVLGMTTVWVRNDMPWSRHDARGGAVDDFIHHVTDDLAAWLKGLVARAAPAPAR